MSPLILLGWAAVLLPTIAPPSPQGGRKPDRLDLPDPPSVRDEPVEEVPPAPSPASLPDPDWAAGEGRADLLLRECLRSRDSTSSFAQEARRHLIALGAEARPPLEAALASKHPAVVVVAADVLARMGARDAVPRLRAAAAGRAPREALDALLRAIATLDPEGSPTFLVGLLAHRSGSVRSRAAAALGDRVRAIDVPALVDVARRAPPDGRERAVRLLTGFEGEEVLALLLEGLDDPAARVARACAELLARSRSLEVVGRLHRVVADGIFTREWAYAGLALALRDEASAEPVVGTEVEPVCLEALGRADPFVSGAAAVVLATIGYRSPDPAAASYLDGAVPDALVRALAGQTFYPDFTSLLDVADRRLVLLTGEAGGRGGPAWAAWWLEHRAGFRANRATFLLPEDVARSLVAVYQREPLRPEEPPVRIAFRAEGVERPSRMGRAEDVFLDGREIEDLATRLRESDLLRRPPSTEGRALTAPGARVLRLSVGAREKTIHAPPSGSDPAFDAIEAHLMGLRRSLRWQRYFDPAVWASLGEFLAAERAFLAGPADATERARHRKRRILGAFPRLRGVEAREALADLEGITDLALVWEPRDDETLLSRLSKGLSPEDFDRAIVAVVLRAHGAESFAALARRLEESFGEWGREVLASALALGSADVRRAAFSDASPFVRAAGARAAGRARDAEAARDLFGLLSDPDDSVRVASVESLGRIGAPEAGERLAALVRGGGPEVRRAALLALGRIPGEAPLEALTLALGDPAAEIRSAAIEGLAERGDARSAGALTAVFLRDLRDAPAESTARRGLLRIGEGAWEALRTRILDPDPVVARSVRFLLAELGDGTVVPALLEERERAPKDPLVEDALARVTLRDFAEDPQPGEAWRAWWEENRRKSAQEWLAEGLAREGFELPGGVEALRRDAPPAVLESLARVVEGGSWPLAARAAALARVIVREDFGTVSRRTSETERGRLAARIRERIGGG